MSQGLFRRVSFFQKTLLYDPLSSSSRLAVRREAKRWGWLIGSGTRPRIDDGLLGVAVLAEAANNRHRPTWKQWMAPSFTVESNSAVPAGVDGEALVFDPPLQFTIRPGALRVRIAPQHPGASPSAAQPTGLVDAVKKLVHIVRTG